MGRLNSTIIDDKKCFIAGQCFIATVREIVTPNKHTLSLSKYNTLLWWAWLHFSKSVDFRCFDWCDYFYKKKSVNSPSHTKKTNTILTTMDNFKIV